MTEHRPLNTAHLPVKLRIEDYLLLDRSGAFDGYAKTELLGGEIYFMNAQHRPHARVKMMLYDAIRDALIASNSPQKAMVEASIAMPDDSVPEPDIVLTSEPDGEGLIPLPSVALWRIRRWRPIWGVRLACTPQQVFRNIGSRTSMRASSTRCGSRRTAHMPTGARLRSAKRSFSGAPTISRSASKRFSH